MNTIESTLDISLYLMLIFSLNLMKIKYCDTETLSSIRAFVNILKTSTMLYILLDNKKRNHTFCNQHNNNIYHKSFTTFNYALTTYKRNV